MTRYVDTAMGADNVSLHRTTHLIRWPRKYATSVPHAPRLAS